MAAERKSNARTRAFTTAHGGPFLSNTRGHDLPDTLKLYHAANSPNSRRVRIFLAEKIPLTDGSNAAFLCIEPVLANGKVYVGTSGGHIYMLEPQNLDVTISMTETQIGPDVYVNGKGFTPNVGARISYSNVPGQTTPVFAGIQNIGTDGTFRFTDFHQEGNLVGLCSIATIGQNVTNAALDVGSGLTSSMTVPAGYWCGNAPVPTNLHGGCPQADRKELAK
jgi:hypothetical protein